MSNIISDQEDLKRITNLFEDFCRRGYSAESLDDVLYGIVPCDGLSHFIDWHVSDSVDGDAFFSSGRERIYISPSLLKNRLKSDVQKYHYLAPKASSSEFFHYLVFWALFHEVEHSHQYLIGMGYEETPYDIVNDVYHTLFSLVQGYQVPAIDKKLSNQILSYFNHFDFTLERNANMESFDLLLKMIDYQGNSHMKTCFEAERAYHTRLGYSMFSNGVMERDLSKKYFKDKDYSQIPVDERVRYGLPVDFKVKTKIMRYHYW